MNKDYYLRAATEADLKAALPFAVHQTDVENGPKAGDWKLSEPGLFKLVLCGNVVTKDAVYEEGESGGDDPEVDDRTLVSPPEIDERFHANLRLVGAFAPEIPDAITVHPKNPRMAFA